LKQTKIQQVLKHLQTQKSITQLEAVKLYGAYRLSSIIFNLRERGYNIATITETKKDRNGNTCNFARYVLKAGQI
jgi:hypothetical protein